MRRFQPLWVATVTNKPKSPELETWIIIKKPWTSTNFFWGGGGDGLRIYKKFYTSIHTRGFEKNVPVVEAIKANASHFNWQVWCQQCCYEIVMTTYVFCSWKVIKLSWILFFIFQHFFSFQFQWNKTTQKYLPTKKSVHWYHRVLRVLHIILLPKVMEPFHSKCEVRIDLSKSWHQNWLLLMSNIIRVSTLHNHTTSSYFTNYFLTVMNSCISVTLVTLPFSFLKKKEKIIFLMFWTFFSMNFLFYLF